MSSTREPGRSEVTIYRYGWIAWVWRAFIMAGLGGGLLCVWQGFLSAQLVLYFVATPLLLPSWFFGYVVATKIDHLGDGVLRVSTLLFLRRRIARSDLGKPRVRLFAQGEFTQFYAPRCWIPVRGRLPIYLDLLAKIPDRSAFANMFRINKNDLPSARP